MIRNCLNQMKVSSRQSSVLLLQICFLNCSREANKLDEAMSKYFLGFGQAPEHTYRIIHRNLSTCGHHTALDILLLSVLQVFATMAWTLRSPEMMGIQVDSSIAANVERITWCRKSQYKLHFFLVSPFLSGELAQTQHECPICKYQASPGNSSSFQRIYLGLGCVECWNWQRAYDLS